MLFWYGGHWVFWQAALMWLVMIAFWALLVWAVIGLAGGATRGRQRPVGDTGPGTGVADARAILDQRLARGEIGPDEYERLRELLDRDGTIRTGQGVPRSPSSVP